MRLILSRKGFDSASGGVPSPIFPDGSLLSLPIPFAQAPVTFAGIGKGGELSSLVEALTGGTVRASDRAHLDPDLDASSLRRRPGWRPAFGQIDAAQTHLAKLGVGTGDLFLFFGWFRAVEETAGGSWRYRADAQDLHVLFGWLQIGEALPVPGDASRLLEERPWLADHPHVHRLRGRGNSIYVSTEHLALDGVDARRAPGAGLFRRVHDELILTKPEQPLRSLWHLPSWFYPFHGRRPLSYHGDPGRWYRSASGAELRTVGRGQEFVLDCAEYPEALSWASRLIAERGLSAAA